MLICTQLSPECCCFPPPCAFCDPVFYLKHTLYVQSVWGDGYQQSQSHSETRGGWNCSFSVPGALLTSSEVFACWLRSGGCTPWLGQSITCGTTCEHRSFYPVSQSLYYKEHFASKELLGLPKVKQISAFSSQWQWELWLQYAGILEAQPFTALAGLLLLCEQPNLAVKSQSHQTLSGTLNRSGPQCYLGLIQTSELVFHKTQRKRVLEFWNNYIHHCQEGHSNPDRQKKVQFWPCSSSIHWVSPSCHSTKMECATLPRYKQVLEVLRVSLMENCNLLLLVSITVNKSALYKTRKHIVSRRLAKVKSPILMQSRIPWVCKFFLIPGGEESGDRTQGKGESTSYLICFKTQWKVNWTGTLKGLMLIPFLGCRSIVVWQIHCISI